MLDVNDRDRLERFYQGAGCDAVCHLAAQVGVRYSLVNPDSYVESNVRGFLSVLECARKLRCSHLVYASSSSVYGLNERRPSMERDGIAHPVSLYAATKKSNELMAHVYSYLYQLPTTGVRFFTVYGPWGRPDMAPFIFTRAILKGEPIDVYNGGAMERDFTFVDDIVAGLSKILDRPAKADREWDAMNPDPSSSRAPYRLYNIGSGRAVRLMSFIEAVEKETGRKALTVFAPMQPGDVVSTHADTTALRTSIGVADSTPIEEGVRKFVQWYRSWSGQ